MGIIYIGMYAKFRCAAKELSSIQGVLKSMGRKVWLSCGLPTRCTSVVLGSKGVVYGAQ